MGLLGQRIHSVRLGFRQIFFQRRSFFRRFSLGRDGVFILNLSILGRLLPYRAGRRQAKQQAAHRRQDRKQSFHGSPPY